MKRDPEQETGLAAESERLMHLPNAWCDGGPDCPGWGYEHAVRFCPCLRCAAEREHSDGQADG